MSLNTKKPVLIVGGSGTVGVYAARTIRRLHPGLPLAIGGRDLGKAQRVAREVGNAVATTIDLERPDLGLPAEAAFSAIVVLLKDDTLHTMKYALDNGLPYVSFSDFVFDIGPEVALYAQKPDRAPILMLGHTLGGTVVLAALHFAREFRTVRAFDIAIVVDEKDAGGPAAATDFARLEKMPHPLVLTDGRWTWVEGDAAMRTVTTASGAPRELRGYATLDVPSLAAASDARSVRLDFGSKPSGTGGRAPVEVIIEIEGDRLDGTIGSSRYELTDDADHSELSARGVALAVERLLGLAGGAPVPPGLYNPETIIDPAHAVERLRELGTRVRRV